MHCRYGLLEKTSRLRRLKGVDLQTLLFPTLSVGSFSSIKPCTDSSFPVSNFIPPVPFFQYQPRSILSLISTRHGIHLYSATMHFVKDILAFSTVVAICSGATVNRPDARGKSCLMPSLFVADSGWCVTGVKARDTVSVVISDNRHVKTLTGK